MLAAGAIILMVALRRRDLERFESAELTTPTEDEQDPAGLGEPALEPSGSVAA